MIEHLIDKPVDEAAVQWLTDVSRTTVLNPEISKDWIVLDHRKALRVVNGNLDSTTSENIYLIFDQKFYHHLIV